MFTLKRVALGDTLYDVKRPWLPQEKSGIFSEVSHLALAPTGEVFVLQRQEPIITIYSHKGELIKEWRHPLLDGGHALHIAEDGRVFLADWDDHLIMVFSSNGELFTGDRQSQRPRFGKPFNHPTDVSIAPNGDLFITDGYGNACVHHFDPQGNHIKTGANLARNRVSFPRPMHFASIKKGISWLQTGKIIGCRFLIKKDSIPEKLITFIIRWISSLIRKVVSMLPIKHHA